MNKEQVSAIKHSTCYLTEVMESNLDYMKEHGMSEADIAKVDNAINILLDLNQKFVKMEKKK